jgi:hypothetical protein
VDSISDGGEFDVASSRIRWGLFLGDGTRTLEYKLTPPKDVADMAVFHGEASFDGYAETIRGNVEALAIQDGKLLRIKGLSRDAEGRIRLTLEGQASQLVAVEVSSNLVDWMQLDPLMLTADEATCEDSQAGGAQRFYRIRPLAK